MYPSQWKTYNEIVPLTDDAIHIWKVFLDIDDESVTQLSKNLSRNEKDKAQRFSFKRDTVRYIAGRARLRSILGFYTGVPSKDIVFEYNKYGKPFLSRHVHANCLNFNVSHSHNLALFAIGHQKEIGIDVEKIQSQGATLDIARRYFSSHELNALLHAPLERKTTMFYNCWTRKEAYIKAKGQGLSIPLDSFAMDLTPSHAALLFSKHFPDDKKIFSIYSFEPEKKYIAALAVGSNVAKIHYYY